MKLIIMRHGRAESSAPYGDANRMLDRYGVEQARAQGEWLKSEHSQQAFGLRVLCSPYDRARQTAENIVATTQCDARIVQVDQATPDGDIAGCIAVLNEQRHDNLILCSHMPFVSVLSSVLLGKTAAEARGFSTAMMLCLQSHEDIWAPGIASELWVKEAKL